MTGSYLARVRVIIVTDGDETAKKAVEIASRDLGLFPLKITAGNPTNLNGKEVLNCILQSPKEPVVVMVDDGGEKGMGPGERVIEYLINYPEQVKILGLVAVASDARVKGVEVDCSVTCDGRLTRSPVNKYGQEEKKGHYRLEGDTVEVLRKHSQLLIIGCGDPGKMNGHDAVKHGAAVTRKCFQEIIEGSRTLIV